MLKYTGIAITLTFLFVTVKVSAQSGCTDPAAINYDAGAVINDGSCIYPATHYDPLLRTQLPIKIAESSGLTWTDGKLWTHNDSGYPALFSIDTTDGHILQTILINNFPNIDWEDITADNDYIYIGDFGNNSGTRTDLKILKIAKADITVADTVYVNAQAINFSYSDQTDFSSRPYMHNYDCEAFVSVGDSLYIFTKNWADMQTRVYQLPKLAGSYTLSTYTSFNVNGLITGATYKTVTKEIALIGYVGLFSNSFLYFLNNYGNNQFFSGNKRKIEIGQNVPWQTEGITLISGDRFFISSETAGTNASLYTVKKNWLWPVDVERALSHTSEPEFYPNPCADVILLKVNTPFNYFSILNLQGQFMKSGDIYNNKISTHDLSIGDYILQLSDKERIKANMHFIKK